MQVGALAIQADPDVVAATITIVRRMQRLMQVGHEMDQKAQCLRAPGVRLPKVRHGLPCPDDLRDHALSGWTVPCGNVMGGAQWNIDIVPGSGFRPLIAHLIGPVGVVDQHRRYPQQLRDLRPGPHRELMGCDGRDDLMTLCAPSQGRNRGQQQHEREDDSNHWGHGTFEIV